MAFEKDFFRVMLISTLIIGGGFRIARFFGPRRSVFVKNLPWHLFADLRFKNRNRCGEFIDDFESDMKWYCRMLPAPVECTETRGLHEGTFRLFYIDEPLNINNTKHLYS